jgi:hypothetical protein
MGTVVGFGTSISHRQFEIVSHHQHDRLMRGQNGFFNRGQHFHGTLRSSNLRSRAWAILHNYWPWSPTCRKNNNGSACPAERLNKKRYAENWLENLFDQLAGLNTPILQISQLGMTVYCFALLCAHNT